MNLMVSKGLSGFLWFRWIYQVLFAVLMSLPGFICGFHDNSFLNRTNIPDHTLTLTIP